LGQSGEFTELNENSSQNLTGVRSKSKNFRDRLSEMQISSLCGEFWKVFVVGSFWVHSVGRPGDSGFHGVFGGYFFRSHPQ
jgi:hypothetical protein